jgi:ubiquinone/menaquinone biosynthesis C-methylase UbiE
MTLQHDAIVRMRFDTLEARFKNSVDAADFRLGALKSALGPLAGRRLLDLGCGKGRFAKHLQHAGAEVIGLDPSSAMILRAKELARVRATARRLPLATSSFHAVFAVEVFEHIARIDEVLAEIHRILRPGGTVAIIDKNAASLNAKRPWMPNVAIKWIDERRGRWMYPPDSPVRERWFWPGSFRQRVAQWFDDVETKHLLSPAESDRMIFRALSVARLMTLWTARKPGGPNE